MAHNFILQIILSLVRYSTEFDLLQHKSLYDYFDCVGIIGNKYGIVSFQDYSNNVFVELTK